MLLSNKNKSFAITMHYIRD